MNDDELLQSVPLRGYLISLLPAYLFETSWAVQPATKASTLRLAIRYRFDDTTKVLLNANNYKEIAMQSNKVMHNQVGDLRFTAHSIVEKELLVRHLVIPGKGDEGINILKWLAYNISKDTFVGIMEQYHPDAHVGKKKMVPSQVRTLAGG